MISFKLSKKKVFSFILASTMVVSISTTTFAKTNENMNAKATFAKTNENINTTSTIEIVAQQLEQYVVRNQDGTFKLDVPNEVLSQFDVQIVNDIKSNMNSVNDLITKGDLKSTESLTVIDPNDADYAIQGGGVTKWERYWWGAKLWLSDADTKNICTQLELGAKGSAAIAGVTAIASGPAAAGPAAVAAIAYFGKSVIEANNAGRGVVITFGGHLAPTWIGGQ